MKEDDETTTHQLHKLLVKRGHQLSIMTIMHCRKELGWTFRGSAYCQMIRDVNKVKHKEWALQHLSETFAENGFQNVIWSNESSIQIETHKRDCFRGKDSPPKRKPRLVAYSLHPPSMLDGESKCFYKLIYYKRSKFKKGSRD